MAGHVGTIARRRDALARAALRELGDRGRIDAGTRTRARGGTRTRIESTVAQSVWYAWCARCDAYHYAPSWARMPADSHISQETEARRLTQRHSVPLRDITFNGRKIVFRDADSGRRLRGAIVAHTYAPRPLALAHITRRSTSQGVRRAAARSLSATLTQGGAGL